MSFIFGIKIKAEFICHLTLVANSINSLADSGVDLDLRCIETVLTDYDSQHLQEQEST